jgi:hypothetical protein
MKKSKLRRFDITSYQNTLKWKKNKLQNSVVLANSVVVGVTCISLSLFPKLTVTDMVVPYSGPTSPVTPSSPRTHLMQQAIFARATFKVSDDRLCNSFGQCVPFRCHICHAPLNASSLLLPSSPTPSILTSLAFGIIEGRLCCTHHHSYSSLIFNTHTDTHKKRIEKKEKSLSFCTWIL